MARISGTESGISMFYSLFTQVFSWSLAPRKHIIFSFIFSSTGAFDSIHGESLGPLSSRPTYGVATCWWLFPRRLRWGWWRMTASRAVMASAAILDRSSEAPPSAYSAQTLHSPPIETVCWPVPKDSTEDRLQWIMRKVLAVCTRRQSRL